MTKKLDPDIKALRGAIRSLNGSSSTKMLKENLDFINDYFVLHQSKNVPKHLKMNNTQRLPSWTTGGTRHIRKSTKRLTK